MTASLPYRSEARCTSLHTVPGVRPPETPPCLWYVKTQLPILLADKASMLSCTSEPESRLWENRGSSSLARPLKSRRILYCYSITLRYRTQKVTMADETLPSYSALSLHQNASPFEDHVYTETDAGSGRTITLNVSARSWGKNAFVFEGDSVSGTVTLDLREASSVKSVCVEVRLLH